MPDGAGARGEGAREGGITRDRVHVVDVPRLEVHREPLADGDLDPGAVTAVYDLTTRADGSHVIPELAP